jgi:hypothetical protein
MACGSRMGPMSPAVLSPSVTRVRRRRSLWAPLTAEHFAQRTGRGGIAHGAWVSFAGVVVRPYAANHVFGLLRLLDDAVPLLIVPRRRLLVGLGIGYIVGPLWRACPVSEGEEGAPTLPYSLSPAGVSSHCWQQDRLAAAYSMNVSWRASLVAVAAVSSVVRSSSAASSSSAAAWPASPTYQVGSSVWGRTMS